jgi:hypothetical protein
MTAVDEDRLTRYRQRVFAERATLLDAMADTAGQQRAVLADLLSFNAGTEFGRAHTFDQVRTIDDFRKAVPIQDYAALAPMIERMAGGETNVLSADSPAVYFTSSGSTGAHKKIPVTPRFMKTSFFPFYYAAWAPMAEHFPEVLSTPDAVLNLKHDPRPAPKVTADGHPHLGASQVDFGTAFGEPLSAEPGTDATWATLPSTVDPSDHVEKTYVRLRQAVAGDVRCVIGINPAMVAAVPYQLRMWLPRMIREIHAQDPRRARELEQLASRHAELRPAHIWPNMRVIFCWTTGLASLYLPRLREQFGADVTVLPAPVAASEGPMGVALDRHPRAGSLVVTAAVHEFVPADEPLGPDSATLLPHELQAGQEYHAIFSHVGGLYRYAVGDVVRVVDMTAGAPRIEYAGRARLSDTAGERLRESQVIGAIAAALEPSGLEVRNAACRVVSGHYEFALAPSLPWNATETAQVAEALDTALQARSPGYRSARVKDRLGRVELCVLDRDAFLRDWHRDVEAGTRPAMVKDRLFRQDDTAWQRLTAPGMNSDDRP